MHMKQKCLSSLVTLLCILSLKYITLLKAESENKDTHKLYRKCILKFNK